MKPKPYPKGSPPGPATQGPIPEGWDVFLDPRTDPIGPMVSATHTMALVDDAVVLAQNLRSEDGVPMLRGGMTASLGTITSNGSYRGHYDCRFMNTQTCFVAVAESSAIRVYKSTDYATWTEITAASGQYATTRLTDNGEPVQFAVVKDPFTSLQGAAYRQDVLIFGQRATAKVAYGENFATGTGQICNVIADISAPTALQARQVIAQVAPVAFGVYDWTNTDYATIAATGAGITMADTSASGDDKNKIRISVTSSVTNGSTCTCVFPSTLGMLQGKQLLIGIIPTSSGFIDSVKIELGVRSGANFTSAKEIWAPTNTYQEPKKIPVLNGTSAQILAFDIETTVGLANTLVDSIRFTWAAPTTSAPTSTYTVDIFAIAATYSTSNPGTTLWGITKYNSSTHTESPVVVLNNASTQYLNPTSFGCYDFGGARVPFSPFIKFRYLITLQNPTSGECTAGVDQFRIYRKRPQDSRLVAVDDYVMATYSGSWAYASGSASDYIQVAGDSNEPTIDEAAPDAFHIAMPTGAAIGLAGERLWVGGKDGTTNAVYVSGYRSPFRFRRFTKLSGQDRDENAPVTIGVSTSVPQRIASLPTRLPGVPFVAIFTDREVLATSGTIGSDLIRTSRISPFGTLSPCSVAEIYGSLLYMDTERQVRLLSTSGTEPITRRIVDDYLAGIPASYVAFAGGACHNERYYLPFTPSGATTNTRILVWSQAKGWWVLDVPPVAVQGIVSVLDGTNNKKRLIAFGLDGTAIKAYEYDLSTQSQDLGTTNISAAITWPEIHFPDGHFFEYTEFGIMADDMASATASVVVTYKPTGATDTFSSSIDVSGNQSLRKFQDPTASGTPRGVAAAVALTVSGTAGKRIYKFLGKRKADGSGFDAV